MKLMSTKKLRITYLFETTTLWGGNKVGLEQAEALSEKGYRITILSKDTGPTWYPLKLSVRQVPYFDASTIPDSDIIVGTFWPTVKAAFESGKGIAVHLCQGYEGSYKEFLNKKEEIDAVYSLRIPKLTVSPHLNKLLFERFKAETYYIGQMVDNKIFYPENHNNASNNFSSVFLKKRNELNVLVVGPFEVDFKNIFTALKGIAIAKNRFSVPIKLTRVSQFSLSQKEEELIKPDVYHFHVPHQNMGEIYRGADIFVSVSKEAEGFGLPALEAMACGIPTVLSTIPSYTGFDDPLNYSVFVKNSDTDAIAEAILEIYGNTPLRKRLIQRGLAVAKKFTKENVANRLNRTFETIQYRDGLSRTKKAWNSYQADPINKQKMHWWDSPVIREHCQRLVTGDPKMNIYTFLKREYIRNPFKNGLSICCGSGEFEMGLIDNAICETIDAYEIAEERVREGIRMAKEKGYTINFHAGDVNRAVFKKNHYDVFFSWSALHHIENLEGVCENVSGALKDGALIVVQEYIGPNQFQWTDTQIELANKILNMLPESLRINLKTGEIINEIRRPGVAEMNSIDPSEAIRSKDIIPVIKQFFDIKTIRYFGGSLYNLLFNEIIGNFDENDEKDTALINLILLLEQSLIQGKILDNNYVFIIAEKKHTP